MLSTILNNSVKETIFEDSATVRMAGFVGDSIVDGPGLRCAIFCQGCPHQCPGCHNPNTHNFNGGTLVALSTLYEKIKAYPLCKGVTFSGGEPFCQAGSLLALAKQLKTEGYELAAYTGYLFEDIFKKDKNSSEYKLLETLDTLVDGKYIKEKNSPLLRFRGSSNQRIINVPQSLKNGAAVEDNSERWNSN